MKAKHTEGLLVVKKDGVLVGGPVYQLPKGPVQSQIVSVCCVEDADQQANTRRLAACWNAFDGMPTEAPEELAGIGGVQGLTNDLGSAMAVIEVSRTLLSDALETFNDNPHQDHEIADRIREFLKVQP
jgi:hypothetical protein